MRLVIAVALVSCGGAPAVTAPVNVVRPDRIPLPADAALGWIAIAPTSTPVSWIPSLSRGPSNPIVGVAALIPFKEPPIDNLALAYDAKGGSTEVAWGTRTMIPYGCDNNQLAITSFGNLGTTPLAPGIVWMLPKISDERPVALAVTSQQASPGKRSYSIGPLALDLVRSDDDHGSLAIAWRGRAVYRRPIVRQRMAGAETTPMDFSSAGDVAVPVPEGAWSFARETILVVFRVPGYEGLSFETIVVNPETGRAVEPLSIYLYQCAF